MLTDLLAPLAPQQWHIVRLSYANTVYVGVALDDILRGSKHNLIHIHALVFAYFGNVTVVTYQLLVHRTACRRRNGCVQQIELMLPYADVNIRCARNAHFLAQKRHHRASHVRIHIDAEDLLRSSVVGCDARAIRRCKRHALVLTLHQTYCRTDNQTQSPKPAHVVHCIYTLYLKEHIYC